MNEHGRLGPFAWSIVEDGDKLVLEVNQIELHELTREFDRDESKVEIKRQLELFVSRKLKAWRKELGEFKWY